MRPRGFSSATRAAGRSWRTSWQKTLCSRTRRAISWPYCAPKSKIRTRSLSGCACIAITHFRGCGFGIRTEGEQLPEGRFVGDFPAAAEPLDVNGAVREKIDLPVLPRREGQDGECVLAVARQRVGNPGLLEPGEEGQQFVESIRAHLLNLLFVRSLRKVSNPVSRFRARS